MPHAFLLHGEHEGIPHCLGVKTDGLSEPRALLGNQRVHVVSSSDLLKIVEYAAGRRESVMFVVALSEPTDDADDEMSLSDTLLVELLAGQDLLGGVAQENEGIEVSLLSSSKASNKALQGRLTPMLLLAPADASCAHGAHLRSVRTSSATSRSTTLSERGGAQVAQAAAYSGVHVRQ